jgi:hypothetical protein
VFDMGEKLGVLVRWRTVDLEGRDQYHRGGLMGFTSTSDGTIFAMVHEEDRVVAVPHQKLRLVHFHEAHYIG